MFSNFYFACHRCSIPSLQHLSKWTVCILSAKIKCQQVFNSNFAIFTEAELFVFCPQKVNANRCSTQTLQYLRKLNCLYSARKKSTQIGVQLELLAVCVNCDAIIISTFTEAELFVHMCPMCLFAKNKSERLPVHHDNVVMFDTPDFLRNIELVPNHLNSQ